MTAAVSSTMSKIDVVLSDLAFPESPRCRDGRVYVSDWGAGEVHALVSGGSEVVARGSAFPMCIDFLPDGRLVVVHGRELLVQETDGVFATYADLAHLSEHGFNDVTVTKDGFVYVGNVDFEFPGGEPRPGFIAVVTPDGRAERVAGGVMFPNGLAVIGDELVVAESYGSRLTAFPIGADGSLGEGRTWADLGEGVPDGICVDPAGRIWYADVPHESCTLVAEGGELVRTIGLDRGAFSCALDGDTLYVATNLWTGGPTPGRNGQLVAVDLSS
ncbi:SMP-30/gluconolactonase/LRE family protein [Nocardioides sp. MH1]|uniref:SMP-30/gluconolactonase/LRE family protein n=1 Tax=Nocardioides sp. MH1 TaxID=3242490 RepID=UPI0035209282